MQSVRYLLSVILEFYQEQLHVMNKENKQKMSTISRQRSQLENLRKVQERK